MPDEPKRHAILKLHTDGMGSRHIAHRLGISRAVVVCVIRGNRDQVPEVRPGETARAAESQLFTRVDLETEHAR